MKITNEIVDSDYYNLNELYRGIQQQFPKFSKWYGLGNNWSRDIEGVKKIDDIFGQIYWLAEQFTDTNCPLEEWIELALDNKIDKKEYGARVDKALGILISLEDACKTIQAREQLVGVITKYVSRK